MNNLTVETEDTFASLLELAANNDVEGFKRSIERDLSGIDEVGLWYGRKKGSKHMVLDHRTPLMVAAIYGSTDVVKLILSVSNSDVNRSCGLDKSTALHCAASGGSINALDVVKVLLEAGADLNLVDANGHCPFDVIVVSPKFQDLKFSLEKFLATNGSNSNSNSPPLSPSPENRSLSSGSDSTSSPQSPKFNEISVISASEKKEYPIDPSLPDIKNSIYSTDEFRMFSFKVRPCSRAYSHDWTECPFVHPGENARRRDPRKYHYSCVPCPDFRKGACRRGDMCEYAHGVFECWLHPAQYRTRLCKDGTNCNRRVCFFAHTPEELRPLYVSTGSAVPSPRSGSTAMDFAAAMNLLPGSPSSPLTPPMSPSAHGISSNMGWPQPNVPSLHLPGSNLQSSRLRSSLNARDIAAEDLDMFSDFDLQQKQLLNELSRLSLNRSTHSKTLTTLSNLEDLFSSESSSPRYSPTPKSAYLNQFQQQQIIASQSPMNANFSPKTMDQPLMQTSFGVPSMSPHGVDPISPMGSRVSMLSQRQQQFRSLSSRDLGSNSSAIGGNPSWAKWGSSNGKPDWSVNADEFGKIRRSSSFELGNNGEEPDLSWVQSLVKESPEEMKEKPETGTLAAVGSSSESSDLHSSQIESIDQSVLSAWLEQKQLDQLMAQ
ncbi:zinc finger CCCH domain-containing protein 30-like [Actinidia eriantha]|uniref:zinc finger CCCH domain-containing protein 30-like n=1 Tax=Actinidia eriantha TaxID=165200 RepID=UPI0025868D43|nr:zinc finger CCCH domain-containing protein 30-like [Actinidia eriantha]